MCTLKKYKIGKLVFGVFYSQKKIKSNTLFSLFCTHEDSKVFYFCKEILPQVKDEMRLIYSDDRNIIYDDGESYYRYVGNFKSGLLENESCMVYKHQNFNCFNVYFRDITNLNEKKLFNALGLEQVLAYHKQIILHSSYIEYKGKGIIFTAPSQTGKSTQARLWKENVKGVEIINGDRSVIGMCANQIMVHGVPFCGTSDISLNYSCTLSCIIVLRQGKENHLEKLSNKDAFKYLYSECSIAIWDRDAINGVIDVLNNIVKNVPVYLYYCVNSKSAIEKVLEVL